MVVSIKKGTPTWTPKFYNPFYGEPQEGTPNGGNPQIICRHETVPGMFLAQLGQAFGRL